MKKESAHNGREKHTQKIYTVNGHMLRCEKTLLNRRCFCRDRYNLMLENLMLSEEIADLRKQPKH